LNIPPPPQQSSKRIFHHHPLIKIQTPQLNPPCWGEHWPSRVPGNQAHWVHPTRSKRSREINPSGPNPVIWAQPVQPTQMFCNTCARVHIGITPGSKGHNARYQTRSCVQSFMDGTSPIKDRAPGISGRGPEISVRQKPRLHQLPIPLCTRNRLTAPKTL
jgi:hypothetical protein